MSSRSCPDSFLDFEIGINISEKKIHINKKCSVQCKLRRPIVKKIQTTTKLQQHSGSLVRFGDSCISLLGNHVLACISIVRVKKLAIFLHKTKALWPTDQMHPNLKSPSISLCLPT